MSAIRQGHEGQIRPAIVCDGIMAIGHTVPAFDFRASKALSNMLLGVVCGVFTYFA